MASIDALYHIILKIPVLRVACIATLRSLGSISSLFRNITRNVDLIDLKIEANNWSNMPPFFRSLQTHCNQRLNV